MKTRLIMLAAILLLTGCRSELEGKWKEISGIEGGPGKGTLEFHGDSTMSLTPPGGTGPSVRQKYVADEDVIVSWRKDQKTGKYRSTITEYAITNDVLILFSLPEHRQEFKRVK